MLGDIRPSRKLRAMLLPASGHYSLLDALRTRHTMEPLAWHWSHWPGRLVNRATQ
jgi:hypothetical protein